MFVRLGTVPPNRIVVDACRKQHHIVPRRSGPTESTRDFSMFSAANQLSAQICFMHVELWFCRLVRHSPVQSEKPMEIAAWYHCIGQLNGLGTTVSVWKLMLSAIAARPGGACHAPSLRPSISKWMPARFVGSLGIGPWRHSRTNVLLEFWCDQKHTCL